jgi:hypothetical protein
MAAMADPELVAEASKMKLDVDAISGEAVGMALGAAFATPKPVIEIARRALEADTAK